MKKIISLFAAVTIIFTIAFFSRPAQASASTKLLPPSNQGVIDPTLAARLNGMNSNDMVTVILTMRKQTSFQNLNLSSSKGERLQQVIQALHETANSSQAPLKKLLINMETTRDVAKFIPFWIINGFSITANKNAIEQLAANTDIYSITADALPITPTAVTSEANVSAINAPALWQLGLTGQGVVIASMDSGVDISHPELSLQWRGGSNSWYDPYGQHDAAPTDLSGHGTQTMGVMVGGDLSGTNIGVAPQAQWIAVKIFNDSGSATATAVHLGYQWLLDPDSDPTTNDAPSVVNNSWSFGYPGCNLDFQLDLQALRAAAILPIFAAGNYGPGANTSVSPANYPEAFAVGAADNTGSVASFSSRGPSACGEAQSIYPEIVAPGVDIFTTDLGGFYATVSGTSLSAPHAAGVLALLLQAYPNLSVDQQVSALINGAADIGSAGPDNDSGFGRLDALTSYQWLVNGGANPTQTPTPLPTFTQTPLPTMTPTSTPSGLSLHIGDLDGAISLGKKSWTATITVKVHDSSENLISGAKVTASWNAGGSLTGSCITDRKGTCKITSGAINNSITSITFTVTDISRSASYYLQTGNHDPDGDSNGTMVILNK